MQVARLFRWLRRLVMMFDWIKGGRGNRRRRHKVCQIFAVAASPLQGLWWRCKIEAVEIRQLAESDAKAFREMRLRALREHPEAFIDDYEAEAVKPIEQAAEQLGAASAENLYLGAFIDGKLAGMAHFYRQEGNKLRHRALIGGMYVAADMRGRGIGRGLLERCIRHARGLPDLEDLALWVILGNERAKALYEAAGFEAFCIEPRAFKIDGRYNDAVGMIMRLW